MKKIFAIFSAALLLASCSNGPKDTVKSFTENISKGKVDEAKKYATESTGKLVDLASAFGGMPIEPNYKFEFIKDSIVDNEAWVKFKNQDGKEEQMHVVKIDGKWLVHMDRKK